MSPRQHRSLRIATLLTLPLLVLSLIAGAAGAAPLVGFVENWNGTSLDGWTGGSIYTNPGTGGLSGAGDGFLQVSLTSPGHLGTSCSNTEYGGNWISAGVNKVRFYLNDVNNAQSLEIHFGIGNGTNFWQYNTGFVPTFHAWTLFTVDLSSQTGWTRTIGSGTFQAALMAVDRILIRHDRAPFQQTPDFTAGDFGIDQLTLTNDAVAVAPSTWSRLKSLYR